MILRLKSFPLTFPLLTFHLRNSQLLFGRSEQACGTVVLLVTIATNNKKGQTFRSDLEEAATYSPTGKPQYHRRE